MVDLCVRLDSWLYYAMAGEGVGQRRGVSDDSSGWGSDSAFDELYNLFFALG